MSSAKDHKFWKEFVNRNDKKFGGGWSRNNQEQGCLMFQKPIKIMLYGILPHSKMIKTVPVIQVDEDGTGDYRRQNLLRHRQKMEDNNKPARNKSREKQICKRCQMEEYHHHSGGGGANGGGAKCSRCKEAVSYHSFRCCTCGIEPMDPRLILWDEGGPRRNGCFDSRGYVMEEGDDDSDGYY